jgi:hypothetical protein
MENNSQHIWGNTKYDDKGKPISEIKNYFCGFCEFRFKHYVRMSIGENHSHGTTPIICPRCTNFIKS